MTEGVHHQLARRCVIDALNRLDPAAISGTLDELLPFIGSSREMMWRLPVATLALLLGFLQSEAVEIAAHIEAFATGVA